MVQCAASWEFHDLQTLTHLERERVAGSIFAGSVAKALLLKEILYQCKRMKAIVQSLQTFSVKGQIINILSFVAH